MAHRRWGDLTGWQRGLIVVGATVQLTLAGAAWADLGRRPAAEVNGAKWRWAAVIGLNFVGPLAYFRWGRRRPA